jgi:hypothetical protein
MKIAVCGSGRVDNKKILEKSFEIGKEIARKNAVLVTGAGIGYPLEAAKGAFLNKGEVIGISPAHNEEEHVKKYGFTTEFFTKIVFTGAGIPRRNFDLIEQCDAAIIIGGQIGTLNEFTIAFRRDKAIGVLDGSGGIVPLLSRIADICSGNYRTEMLLHSASPRRLVAGVIERLKRRA